MALFELYCVLLLCRLYCVLCLCGLDCMSFVCLEYIMFSVCLYCTVCTGFVWPVLFVACLFLLQSVF